MFRGMIGVVVAAGAVMIVGCDSEPVPEVYDDPADAALRAVIEEVGKARRVKTYADLKRAIELNPTDVDSQVDIVHLLSGVSYSHVQKDNKEKAAIAMKSAVDWADKSTVDVRVVSESVRQLFSRVLFEGARLYASEGNVERAEHLVGRAVALGFDDFESLQNDEDLKVLRESDRFADDMNNWHELAAETIREEGRAALEQGVTFPFHFAVDDLSGNELSLEEFKGKVVVVDIWGTWCEPCRTEIPSFIELQEKYGEQGLQVVGLSYEKVSSRTATELVSDVVEQTGVNYRCAVIGNEVLNRIPDMHSFPTTLFIDRKGKIRLRMEGAHGYKILEAVVLALLDESAPNANGLIGSEER